MTLATGLVLAVVVGTLAQKSDTVMAFFGGGNNGAAQADQFTVRAGSDQTLDVLSNDTLEGKIIITEGPTCGVTQINSDGAVNYTGSLGCAGQITFSYCIESDTSCDVAKVDLTVIKPEVAPNVLTSLTPGATDSREPTFQEMQQTTNTKTVNPTEVQPATTPAATPTVAPVAVATARTETVAIAPDERLVAGKVTVQNDAQDTAVVGFNIANAPALFSPDTSELIQPQETVDTLRRSVAAIAPSQISQDENIAAQSTASVQSSIAVASNGLQNASAANLDQSPTLTFKAPSAPRISGSAPALLPAQQVETIARGPEVSAHSPRSFASNGTLVTNEPVRVSNLSDRNSKLVAAEALADLAPGSEPLNVDTNSATVGAVRVAAKDPADSSDIVFEMAAQIILPSPQLTQSLERDQQTTPETAALLSDHNFVANLDPATLPENPETQVASLPAANTVIPVEKVSCDTSFSAIARPGAEVSVTVTSLCQAGNVATFDIGGLKFSEIMDANGTISVEVPALSPETALGVVFADGATASTQIMVRDVDSVERVAVIWSAPVAIDLNAFENGAKGNEAGHVWSGNPRKYRDTLTSGGGFLQVLGNPEIIGGYRAEVYSLPTNRLRNSANVRMDLNITDASMYCGKAMILKTIRTQANSTPAERSFNLPLPDCSVAANGLVLENFIDAISVARR